jgi:hypothetical protein
MKKLLVICIVAALICFAVCSCTGCGSSKPTEESVQHIRGNVSRIFLHDPGTYNYYSADYKFIPGYYSVLERHESKQVLWHVFCGLTPKVIVDVEKGGPCWFEADIANGRYANIVIHIWSEKQIERSGSGGAKFGVTDD